MNLDLLKQELIRDEGLELKPYQDTVGKWTIGVGRNLDDRGISKNEAGFMLGNDIMVACTDLDRNVPEWRELPDPVQRALANMSFNLGWPRLSTFKKMWAAIAHGNYEEAAAEALDSKWATQVGERAQRIAALIRSAA